MAPLHGKGPFSYKIRVFVLLWIFLQNFVVALGGDLLSIYFQKFNTRIAETPFYWSPNYWIGGGGVLGGVFILMLSHSIDIKSHFCAVRYIQILAIGLVFTLYKGQEYEWAVQYWTPGVCLIFFLQGAADTMSKILSPVYLMCAICDRDLNEAVGFLILVNTQLPLYLSSFFTQLLSINPLFMTLGVGVFGGLFFLVLVFSIFLPKTSQNGKETEKSEYIEYWHLQFEGESGWLRPAMTVCALYLLSDLSGIKMYKFYGSWTLRLALIPLEAGLMTAGISFIALLIALLAWSNNKLPYFLVVSTGLLAVCSFLSGILLHGLEDGEGIPAYAPLSLHIAFAAAHAVGLGPLPAVISAFITTRITRLGIFSAGGILIAAAGSLTNAAVPLLIQILHPFGVFWFHSGILLLGLVFICLGVLGQLRDRSYPSPACDRPIEEFITQV